MNKKEASKKNFYLNASEKDFCVELARKSIKYFLETGHKLLINNEDIALIPEKLLEKKACFVTLKINDNLRGCIGHLIAIQPLYLDIIDNAIASAFNDPRFNPLNEKEFGLISIEVSILTNPIQIDFSDSKDLLSQITPRKDGLIISKHGQSATFLPSVWEEIPSKEEFLSQLCLKAGLDVNAWKTPSLSVQKYYAIKAISHN